VFHHLGFVLLGILDVFSVYVLLENIFREFMVFCMACKPTSNAIFSYQSRVVDIRSSLETIKWLLVYELKLHY
jgi:hypothetical protein